MKIGKIIKYLLLTVSVLTALLVLSSCKNETGPGKREETPREYFDSVPDNLDFNGEKITVIHWNNDFVNRELVADETTNDALDKAVLERNRSVSGRLNVELQFVEGDVAPEYYMPIVQEDILAGTADFDIVSGVQCQAGQLCIEGCYLDLSAAKYLDLSKKYWNSDYINQMKIGSSRVYMLGGDISLTTTAWASTMLYDIKLYSELFGSTDKFYDEILAGEWTLDNFFNKCRNAYADLNGNNERDEGDRYGLGLMTSSSIVDMFCFSSGVKFTSRDQNNYPILNINNDSTITFLKIFTDAVNNNAGIWAYKVDDRPDSFIRSLFEATTMDSISTNTHDFNDFGVIPYPKLQANDKKYKSWISDNTSVYSVPITLEKSREDAVFAVLELMASETRRICLPAYYETALIDKYTRDAQSRTMLDIIHDGATADFVSVYSEALGGIGTIMRQEVAYGEGDLLKNYSDRIIDAESKLTELISEYEKNTSEDQPDQSEQNTDTDLPDDSDYKPENAISDAWRVLGGKYRISGVLLSTDISDTFSYAYSGDEIVVKSPPNSYKGGYFPTAVIQSKDKLPLDGLSVRFKTDNGFLYTNAGYSASYSFVWTDKPIEALPQYTDQIGTNGLREALPDGAHALSVIFMGTMDTSGPVSNLMYIVMHDGTDAAPEIDHRRGYRWAFRVDTDLSSGVDISVREDDELGYVVSVNGVEYREGKRGEETIPVDLTPLCGTDLGHIAFGAEATGKYEFANFTVSSICGKPASRYFTNETDEDTSAVTE